MEIKARKEFESRGELDDFIAKHFGNDDSSVEDFSIEVTPDEAKRLGLSDSVRLYGVRVRAIQEDTNSNVKT